VVEPKLPSIKLGQLYGKGVTIDHEAFKAGFTQPAWQNNWQTDSRSAFQAIAGPVADYIASTIEKAVSAGNISSDDIKKNLTDPLLKGLKDLVESIVVSLTSATEPITTLKSRAICSGGKRPLIQSIFSRAIARRPHHSCRWHSPWISPVCCRVESSCY